jgi:hypothetical protein
MVWMNAQPARTTSRNKAILKTHLLCLGSLNNSPEMMARANIPIAAKAKGKGVTLPNGMSVNITRPMKAKSKTSRKTRLLMRLENM